MVFKRKMRGDKVIPVLVCAWSVEEQQAIASMVGVPNVGISQIDNEMNNANYYNVSYKSPDAAPIDDNGTIIIALTIGSKPAHVLLQGAAGGDAQAELFEDTEFSAGTPLTEYNRNRTSLATPGTVAVLDPTISVAGTLLFDTLLPGGTGGLALGTAAITRNKWILAPTKVYMLRLTNRAGGAQPMSGLIEWFEKDL